MLYLSFLIILSVIVYINTVSFKNTLLFIVVFILVNGAAIQLIKSLSLSGFKKAVYFYGKAVDSKQVFSFDNLIRGVLFVSGKPEAGRVAVDDAGIYVHKTFVCSVVFQWENIKKISYSSRSNIEYAQLYFSKDGLEYDELSIPWSRKYAQYLPGRLS